MMAVCRYAALAIAPSTRRTYNAGQRCYLEFCKLQRWPALPATDLMLSTFAAFLTSSVQPQTIRIYLSAVRTLHTELGYSDPVERAPLLTRVLRGIDRSIGIGPVKTRLPITISVLRKIVDALDASCHYHPVDQAMLRAAVLTAFFGFLRCSEFTCQPPFNSRVHTTRSDITFDHGPPVAMSLFLKRSKTDPFGKGTTVHIGSAIKPYCAVGSMLVYLLMSNHESAAPLFQYQIGQPLTRADFVKEVQKLLVSARLSNVTQYSGHSFRIGAATTAAAAGTPEWLVRAMGRWKSDAVLRYIRTEPDTLRSIARRLGSASL